MLKYYLLTSNYSWFATESTSSCFLTSFNDCNESCEKTRIQPSINGELRNFGKLHLKSVEVEQMPDMHWSVSKHTKGG